MQSTSKALHAEHQQSPACTGRMCSAKPGPESTRNASVPGRWKKAPLFCATTSQHAVAKRHRGYILSRTVLAVVVGSRFPYLVNSNMGAVADEVTVAISIKGVVRVHSSGLKRPNLGDRVRSLRAMSSAGVPRLTEGSSSCSEAASES